MDLKLLSDEGDVLRVEIAGPIVRSDVPPDSEPLDTLLGPGGYARRVLISLAGITLIDSICLAWLLVVHKRFREAGGTMVVHSIRPPVMEILALIRFEQVLYLAEDETAALAVLRGENS
ncbi:MAG TPA: STAS domain-containing protein [Thermoguttaceae bacterium]|nr:STAS domain-containing protein [Thermoguttaceae bacterium]